LSLVFVAGRQVSQLAVEFQRLSCDLPRASQVLSTHVSLYKGLNVVRNQVNQQLYTGPPCSRSLFSSIRLVSKKNDSDVSSRSLSVLQMNDSVLAVINLAKSRGD